MPTTEAAPCTERPAQLSEEQQVVAEAYLRDLASQSRRKRELNDLRERDHDRLQAYLEILDRIISAASQRLLEKELWETAEEFERKDKRRRKFPHPGGFDTEGKILE